VPYQNSCSNFTLPPGLLITQPCGNHTWYNLAQYFLFILRHFLIFLYDIDQLHCLLHLPTFYQLPLIIKNCALLLLLWLELILASDQNFLFIMGPYELEPSCYLCQTIKTDKERECARMCVCVRTQWTASRIRVTFISAVVILQ